MALKLYKPITPGMRGRIDLLRDEITAQKPEKSLTTGKKSNAGRDSHGRISVRHQGGGHKRKYREIDFKRNKYGIPGTVRTIEYDPNRSANIALIFYADGEKRYILAPKGLKVGQKIMSGTMAALELANALPLESIPVGFTVHNVELTLGKGGQMARSAGAAALIAAKEGDYADHMNINLGKAGRARWRGIRPSVRGMAMNPVDHPLGGGEGRGKGRNPVTPWGQPCKGYKTRKKKNTSDRFIVSRRK